MSTSARLASFALAITIFGVVSAPSADAVGLRGYSPFQRAAFSAFSSASSASDELPRSVQVNVIRLAPGAELGLSRLILADETGTLYFLPAPGEVCAVAIGDNPGEYSQACTPEDAAAKEGFFWLAGAWGSGSQTITGVVPNGITTATLTTAIGGTISAQVTAAGGYRLAFGGTATKLTLSGNGRTIEEPLTATPEPPATTPPQVVTFARYRHPRASTHRRHRRARATTSVAVDDWWCNLNNNQWCWDEKGFKYHDYLASRWEWGRRYGRTLRWDCGSSKDWNLRYAGGSCVYNANNVGWGIGGTPPRAVEIGMSTWGGGAATLHGEFWGPPYG